MRDVLAVASTLVLFVALPFPVFADSGPGPSTCLTNYDSDLYNSSGEWKLDGPTCKDVSIENVVSLDIALQDDYVLGTHGPIGVPLRAEYLASSDQYVLSDFTASKYSEYIDNLSTSSTTFIYGTDYATLRDTTLIDKDFFTKEVARLLRAHGISVADDNLVSFVSKINVLNLNEIKILLRDGGVAITPEEYLMRKYKLEKMNEFVENSPYDRGKYEISTTDYGNWGKHIYAPKNTVVESQYVDIDRGNLPSDTALQLSYISGKHCDSNCVAVVPLTSPLESITNYWAYTKKNGRLVLAWQKSVYSLDSGHTKVITNADTNISATLLFGNPSSGPDVAQKKGFLAELLDWVLSWFR